MLKKASSTPNVVCYGEILWDVLPSAIKPGGAPMNVAYHLTKMGIETHLISRVGNDKMGRALLSLLKRWKIDTTWCQTDEQLATSEVHALISVDNEVSYDIRYPVAWDHISFEERYTELLTNADAFVYGSLSSRDSISRKTVFKMLEISQYNVLDINLRAPHFSPHIISELLRKAHVVKLNAAELGIITKWFNEKCVSEDECVNFLQNEFKIEDIIVTKGGNGASYYAADKRFDCLAFKVKVADTVGAGDAFLAGFLSKKLRDEHADNRMMQASALGAFVTMHEGACPDYDISDIENFKTDQVKLFSGTETF